MYGYTREQKPLWKQHIIPMLPQKISSILQYIDDHFPLEELRIRAGAPLQLYGNGEERLLYASNKRPAATIQDCADIFSSICGYSVYAWEDEIRNGFITLAGGYRVGISGRVVRDEKGMIMNIVDISSLNFRIARALPGVADTLVQELLRKDGTLMATLIISPPGQGKTTMLRDLIRQISYGIGAIKPCKVAIVDERMELSGAVRGVPQYDVGPRSDVICGCSKPEGIRLAVRTLSPELVATDELGTKADADAVEDAAYCGVTTLATAHANGLDGLFHRNALLKLVKCGVIERIVELGRSPYRNGEVKGIYDSSMRPLKSVDAVC